MGEHREIVKGSKNLQLTLKKPDGQTHMNLPPPIAGMVAGADMHATVTI